MSTSNAIVNRCKCLVVVILCRVFEQWATLLVVTLSKGMVSGVLCILCKGVRLAYPRHQRPRVYVSSVVESRQLVYGCGSVPRGTCV